MQLNSTNNHFSNQIKSHYDEPSLMRQATIIRFNEKYDTPSSYYQLNQHQNQNQNLNHHHNQYQNQHHFNHFSNSQGLNQSKSFTPSQSKGNKSKLRSAKSLGSLTSNSHHEQHSHNLLSDCEIIQIESFLRAHKSYVYVGRCLVNLYFTKTDLINGGRNSKPRIHEWELSRTGVPVIIFDKGETRSRDKRQLQICLAERGSGFVLWKDIIDNLSDYSAHHPCFHTLYLSSDHRKMAGLSFDSQIAAQQFLEQIETLTSDPLNIALTGPKKSGKKFNFLKKKPGSSSKDIPSSKDDSFNFKLPKKCDISSPCLFQHVTSVELCDSERLFSLSTLVPSYHRQSSSSPSSIQLSSSIATNSISNGSSVTPTSTSPSIISSESNVSV